MRIKDIAQRSGYSATTVSDVVHGKRFPTKDVARAIIAAMGADFGEVDQLWQDLNVSVHHAVPVAPAGVLDDSAAISWYQDNGEFYAAARQSIMTATREIRVTYVRQYAPSEVTTSEAADYFAAILDWAGLPGARSVKRIFGVPAPGLRARGRIIEFLRQHAAETEHRNLGNYQARVYEYTAVADGLNMALFDQEVAFLAVSGFGPQDLSGMRIDNARYTATLVRHFDQLLAGSKELHEYIEDLDQIT
jgi:transcriptional regulator with XRE-family HTH domain